MIVLVTVKAFGSIWERRFGRDSTGVMLSRAAYYNTTGVFVNGRVRHRWTTGGKIRFNAVGGFNPDYPLRSVNRVYECNELRIGAGGWKELLFHRMSPRAERPDLYLFVLTAGRHGLIDTHSNCWKAVSVEVIAVSEHCGEQEAMLLMPPYSWVRTELGSWFAEPSPNKCWTADLQLSSVT